MKTYLFLAIVLTALAFQSNVSAQVNEPVYLETDRLFRNIASQEIKGVPEEYLDNLGRFMEIHLNDYSYGRYREREAALDLIQLQNNPRDFVLRYGSERENAIKLRNSLEADTLFIEYMQALIKPSLSFPNDPLKRYISYIQTAEGKSMLRTDLDSRLGKGVKREEKAAQIIREMKATYTVTNIEQLRRDEWNGTPRALPYPLCLITKRCPR